MLCSVVKHLESGDSTQEVGRNTRLGLVFSPLPACFTTEQSTVKASLFVNSATENLVLAHVKNYDNFHTCRLTPFHRMAYFKE